MVKRIQTFKLSLFGILMCNLNLVAMEQNDPLKPQKNSVPKAEKIARLQSLKNIPNVEQSQFRKQEMVRLKKSAEVQAYAIEDAIVADYERKHEPSVELSEFEKQLLDEYKQDQEERKRNQDIELLKQQLLLKEKHGAPHIIVVKEAADDVSDLLRMEADDYLKDTFEQENDPTEVQIQLYWKKQLENAIKLANIKDIKRLLKMNVPLDMHDESGDTPLHWAIVTELPTPKKILLLQLLIDSGADINAVNNDSRTPVHLAALALHDSPELLTFMHAQSAIADLNLMDMQGETPLHAAVSKGRADLVKVLLAHKADVHSQNLKGLTPLQVVFESGLMSKQKSSIVSDLIEAGAEIEVLDADKSPLLFKAIKSVDLTGVELLLGYGANFNAVDVRNRTALEFAHHKVETSSNDNTRKILDIVQSYVDGRKQPFRYTQHTPKVHAKRPPGVWIGVPLALHNKVDEKLFQEKVFSEFQETNASGKTRFQRILEECIIKTAQ